MSRGTTTNIENVFHSRVGYCEKECVYAAPTGAKIAKFPKKSKDS